MTTPTFPSPQQTAWTHLEAVSRKWFHSPDMIALRACLATTKALDTTTNPIWMMLVGPSSCGKTEYYTLACRAYAPHVQTDEVSLAGLMTMTTANRGKGVLQTIGKRGLWIVNDYSTVLSMNEDKRNAVNSACRRIYDGEYSRSANGETEHWNGHVNMLAACTPAIEKFNKHTADLGERFISVRVWKSEVCDNFVRCMNAQREHRDEYHADILAATKSFLRPGAKATGKLPFSLQRLIVRWAEFVAICRVQVERNWKEEIISVNHEEGSGRVGQQMLGLACGDAALFGHEEVNGSSMEVIQRVAYDCLPWARGTILRKMPVDVPIRRSDLQEIVRIAHPFTFERALDELEAIGVLKRDIPSPGVTMMSFTDRPKKLLLETVSALETATSTHSPLEREGKEVSI